MAEGRERTRASSTRTSEDKPKARPTRPAVRKTTRTPKPPVVIKPGWIHHSIARFILKGIHQRGKDIGVEINVGETKFETPEEYEETREPEELLARILAHLGHRLPFLRKIEKNLEGENNRSGIMSDIAAFFTQLYARNEDVIDQLRRNAIDQAKTQRRAKKSQTEANDASAEPSIRIVGE